METEIKDDKFISELHKICLEHQEEYISGRWYITVTGLKKVAKKLDGDYTKLTKNQKKEFRNHCIISAEGYHAIKTWWYYLNI